MDRLLYVAMTGAKQLMQAQSLVAHNLANISTTGFRADLARFEAAPVEGPGYPSRINTVAAGVGFDHSQGPLVQTGSPLDVAVEGPGWIAVQAKDGSEAYTRGASLNVNALGLLQTDRGELVLGDNGPRGGAAEHEPVDREGRHAVDRAARARAPRRSRRWPTSSS